MNCESLTQPPVFLNASASTNTAGGSAWAGSASISPKKTNAIILETFITQIPLHILVFPPA
jgi:hypothetical protein